MKTGWIVVLCILSACIGFVGGMVALTYKVAKFFATAQNLSSR